MHCVECGMTIPEQPEGSTYDMLLCDLCYMKLSDEESIEEAKEKLNGSADKES